MKILLLITILSISTPFQAISAEHKHDTPIESMYTYAEGIVFPCMNEETNPYGTCFKVNGQPWGLVTPGFDPKPGEKIHVRFTLVRMLNMPRDNEDEFYVSMLELTSAFNPPKVIQPFIEPNEYNRNK